ncbi:MAG: hypothetical protein AAF757_02285 [Cyanobacteria bacterium P01_D01_bin.116]
MPHQNAKNNSNEKRTRLPQDSSLSDIFSTAQDTLEKLKNAFTVEIETNTYILSSIRRKEFDFLRLEGDVNQIHHEHSFNTRGDSVVGTYVTLNVERSPYILEIETHFYNQIRKENLKAVKGFKVYKLKNIPNDLSQELRDDGYFRIFFANN